MAKHDITDIRPLAAGTPIMVPLVASMVKAGFPSPADDYLETPLDLNEKLIHNPAATFIVRVSGDSMKDASILPGDYLVVDKSLDAHAGSIVVAVVNNEFTLKRLRYDASGQAMLVAEEPRLCAHYIPRGR